MVNGSDTFGVMMHAAGAGSYECTLLSYNKSTQQLILQRLSSSGVATQWARKTKLSLSNQLPAAEVRQRHLHGLHRRNAVAHLHAQCWPSAHQVEAHTRVGIGSVDDTAVTFDNFMVYPL